MKPPTLTEFAEKHCGIKNEDGTVTLLSLNDAQRSFLRKIEEAHAKGLNIATISKHHKP